ncbi:hypothetical protein [Streptomyces olivaceiscleroticus]|uniref:Uncharacterized protein n=1 Tax=Streptomyces olivaceiscleroticus TaxID=68245 RepID=A0ABP3LJV7_9ACTN
MSTPTRTRTLRARLVRFIEDATGRITAAWRILTTAQERLLAALARIRPGRGATAAIRTATGVFQRQLASFDRAVTAFAERWASQDLPLAYREGAFTMLENADRPTSRWAWTRRHQEAVTALSAQYYSDLMSRLQEALRRARAFLRAAQDAARGVTFDPDQLRAEHPLDRVIYAGDHRHPVHAWAEAALSWQTVATANAGAARTALDDLNISYLEVRDGSGCGWSEHNDPDLADRTLRTVQDALAHPAAHPRCIREFLPRMDLVGRTDIESGALL